MSFSEALRRHAKVFPAEYPSLVEAGTRGGDLARILRHVETYHDLRDRIARGTRRILIYVGMGLVICTGVFVILTPFIHHSQKLMIYYGPWPPFRRQPPVVSRIADWIVTNFLASSIFLILGVAVAALALGAFRLLASRTRLGYAIPVWGRIQRHRDVGLFCISMALQLDAGTPLPQGLRLAGQSIPNAYARGVVDRVRKRIEDGEDLASALFYLSWFPRTLAWATSLGAARDGLPDLFDHFAKLYASEIQMEFEVLYVLLSPLGILILGNLVFFFISSVYLPLFGFWKSMFAYY